MDFDVKNVILFISSGDQNGLAGVFLCDILVKQKSEVMSMILTEYNEKLHMKTVRKEGYDDGYDEGYGEGARSRQQEVDELNSKIEYLKKQIEELKQ